MVHDLAAPVSSGNEQEEELRHNVTQNAFSNYDEKIENRLEKTTVILNSPQIMTDVRKLTRKVLKILKGKEGERTIRGVGNVP